MKVLLQTHRSSAMVLLGLVLVASYLRAEEDTPQARHDRVLVWLRHQNFRGVKYIKEDAKEAEEVEIMGQDYTNQDMSHLADLPELKYLFARDLYVTNNGLAFLAHAKELEDLTIVPGQYKKDFWPPEQKEPEADEGFLKHLEGLAKLRSISAGFWVTDRGVKSLGKIKSLQSINIDVDHITAEGFRQLQGLPNLHTLILSYDDEDLIDLVAIAKLTEVDRLMFQLGIIRGEDIAKLKSLHHLRRLELFSTKIRGGLEGLQELPYLEELNLSGTNITDDDMASVAKVKTLKKLRLFNTEITDKGLASLAKLYNLQELDITATKVTAVGLKEFKRNPFIHLEKIIVTPGGKNGIPNKPMAELRDSADRVTIEGYDFNHPYDF